MGREFEGRRYIFNTQAQWRTQIPWLTEWDFRKILEDLLELGLITVKAFNDFGRDRTGHYTINYDHEWLTSLYSNLSNASEASKSDAFEECPLDTNTTPNSSSNIFLPLPPQEDPEPEREREDQYLEIPELPEVDWDDIQTQINQDHQRELADLEGSLDQDPGQIEDPWFDQSSAQSLDNQSVLDEVSTTAQEPEVADDNSTKAGVGFSKARPVKRGEQAKEVWEIAPGQPYPVFLNWRAKTKYVPQGGHWEADALGNAYAEFYNNRPKTTVAIFPQFLEYMKDVAENCNQAAHAEMKVILPSLFKVLPDPTEENVRQLMSNVQQLINNGASVALPQNITTPSCSQSISWPDATNTTIALLPQLQHVNPALPHQVEEPSLAELIQIKRSAWKNVPLLRASIKKWVEETDGVELGEDGPVLSNNI